MTDRKPGGGWEMGGSPNIRILALPGGIQHEEKDDQGPPPRL
jgi:hypothetical protein